MDSPKQRHRVDRLGRRLGGDATRTPALPTLLPYFQSLPLPSRSPTEDDAVPSPAEVRRLSSLNSHFNQSQGDPVQISLSHCQPLYLNEKNIMINTIL